MDKKILVAALKEQGSYYDISTNTLYISPAFKKKSAMYGTAECDLLDKVSAQNKALTIVEYKASRKSRITYCMMETFICNMPSAKENYEEYKRIKAMSHAYRSPFKFVSDWFEKKYPYYDKLLETDQDGNVKWNALENYRTAQREAEASKASSVAEDNAKSEEDVPMANAENVVELYAHKEQAAS